MKFFKRVGKTFSLVGALWIATGILEAPVEAREAALQESPSPIVSSDENPPTAPQSSYNRLKRAKAIQLHPELVRASIKLEQTARAIRLIADKNGGDEFPGQRRGGGTHVVPENQNLAEGGGDEFPGQRRGGGTHAIDENGENV